MLAVPPLLLLLMMIIMTRREDSMNVHLKRAKEEEKEANCDEFVIALDATSHYASQLGLLVGPELMRWTTHGGCLW